MSQHKATITWDREAAEFAYKSYPRDHTWSFDSVEVLASAAPDYLGSESRVDPEQAFVAALSSCHMLTFLAIAAKKKFVVDRYVDEAAGTLEENGHGELAITRVVLKPQVTFEVGNEPDQVELERLHHSPHKHCFIANSVKTVVKVEF